MIYTAGIDVGSTYTKAIVLSETDQVVGRGLIKTGFKLNEAADRALQEALAQANLDPNELAYSATAGYGRVQVPFRNVNVTDLTAAARGAHFLFPKTQTVLDVGGQTMKASRLDDRGHVRSFRLNDKCAAGTGAFLEKTARYMGYKTEEIGTLAAVSKNAVQISGVCAVFAESEVINHLSQGSSPSDIMFGAITSLVARSTQLIKRVGLTPEFTLIGGILRYESMGRVVREQLKTDVNVAPGDMVQFVSALGAAILGFRRMEKMSKEGTEVIS